MEHIIIQRPELTPDERARRMEGIRSAAVRLLLAMERAKREETK